MTFAQGHALVIGVGDYQYAPALDSATDIADAQAVEAVLLDERSCGYPPSQVTLLTGPATTRDRVREAFDRLSTRTGRDDTVFIFYSGHGLRDRHGNYHLLTHDSRVQADPSKPPTTLSQQALLGHLQVEPGTALSQQALLGHLRTIKAKRLLLICNACYAGYLASEPIEQNRHSGSTTLPRETTDALLATGSGRIVITAAGEEQRAFVGPDDLSLFSQALVAGLRGKSIDVLNRQGFISVFDLYTHLYNTLEEWVPSRVPAAVRQRYNQHTQQPQLSMLNGIGPFAVALYQGAAQTGVFSAPNQPEPHTAVHLAEPDVSRRLLERLLQETGTGTTTNQYHYGDNYTNNGGQQFIGSTINGGQWFNDSTIHQNGSAPYPGSAAPAPPYRLLPRSWAALTQTMPTPDTLRWFQELEAEVAKGQWSSMDTVAELLARCPRHIENLYITILKELDSGTINLPTTFQSTIRAWLNEARDGKGTP